MAIELYWKYGPMSDTRLYEEFVGDIAVRRGQIRKLREDLEDVHIVHYTGQVNREGQPIYWLTPDWYPGGTQHD
jgi:hypothetical protein